MTKARAEAALIALFLAAPAAAGPCRQTEVAGIPFAVCTAKAGDDLRLFLNGPDGAPLGSFGAVRRFLASEGKELAFAMNAGMYHPDRRPVGLYVENGKEIARLQTGSGDGNFGLKPNGVFCVKTSRFAVITTETFAGTQPTACRYATQSGPMLLIGGKLHPRFLAASDSFHVRNGVGVAPDGQTAYFVISNRPVNFFAFAEFFRDQLGVKDALYLDGSISRLYAPDIGRDDFGLPMGPIVGVVTPISADAGG